MEKQRNRDIDILKGVAIVLVVAGHSGAPFTHFIYLFHVAVFFIASAYFYNERSSDSIKSLFRFTVKKIKQLWVPFFIWNGVFVLCNNFFLKSSIYSDMSPYYSLSDMIRKILWGGVFRGSTQMGGGLWFLAILFIVSCMYCFSDYCIKRITNNVFMIQLVWSIILLHIGYALGLKGIKFFGIEKALSIYILYFLGVQFGRIEEEIKRIKNYQWIILGLVSFALLLLLNRMGDISLANNDYTNPVFLIVCSLLGWILFFSVSHMLSLCKLGKAFEYIGKRTLIILALHFLSFKIVAEFIIIVYKLPAYKLSEFPNLWGNHRLWWVIYIIVGVCTPLLLENIAKKLLYKGKQAFTSRKNAVNIQRRTP